MANPTFLDAIDLGSDSGTSSSTFTYVAGGSGTGRAVVFELGWGTDAGTLASATYGGQALTLVTVPVSTYGVPRGHTIAYRLLDGSESGTDLVWTFSGASACETYARASTFGEVGSVAAVSAPTGFATSTDFSTAAGSTPSPSDFDTSELGVVALILASMAWIVFPPFPAPDLISLQLSDQGDYVDLNGRVNASFSTGSVNNATFLISAYKIATGSNEGIVTWDALFDRVAAGDNFTLTSIGLALTGPEAEDEFNCECDEETENENLGQLRTRMLIRLGYAAQAANPPPGMALLLDDFLRSAQRFLYGRYRALRTERFFTWTMEEGGRFYDLPDNDETCTKRLDPYRLTWVGVEDSNGVWTPLIKGIPPTFYTGVMNNGIPERYEIRQCIEVFPAPVEGYKLRIKGHFGLTSFTEDEDQTTIDSELVFLWALGSAKAHYGQPDATTVKSEANVMLGNLVAGTHQTARYVPNTWQIPPMTRPLFTGLDP